jgi:hypothetical protein
MKKILIIYILPWFLVFLFGYILYKSHFGGGTIGEIGEDVKVVSSHRIIQERIVSLGKLEVVKYYLKDIVEHEVKNPWYLPDPKAVLIASGEVVGCIDLTRIDSADLKFSDNKISIRLPQPELCYFKINHADSKVYSIEKGLFQESELIDAAYKEAELHLQRTALQMKIMDQTRENAKLILKPLLEKIADKEIELTF